MTRWWGNRASGGGCSIHLRRREVLAVHPDYFQLTGGLERGLYRIARKAVPDKAKVPATRPLRNFAGDLRKMADSMLPWAGTTAGIFVSRWSPHTVEFARGSRSSPALALRRQRPNSRSNLG